MARPRRGYKPTLRKFRSTFRAEVKKTVAILFFAIGLTESIRYYGNWKQERRILEVDAEIAEFKGRLEKE